MISPAVGGGSRACCDGEGSGCGLGERVHLCMYIYSMWCAQAGDRASSGARSRVARPRHSPRKKNRGVWKQVLRGTGDDGKSLRGGRGRKA